MERKFLLACSAAILAAPGIAQADNGLGVAKAAMGEAARAVVFEEPNPLLEPVVVEIDVGALVASSGLVADDNDPRLAHLGRVSLQFDETAAYEPPFDVRDQRTANLRTLAAPAERTPLTSRAIGEPAALVGAQGARSVRINYESMIAAFDANGLGVEIAPRANVLVARDVSAASAGAEVRIGRNFRRNRSGDDDAGGGWYIFAGADAQALTWRPTAGVSVANSVQLQDQILVGDAQAGIAWRVGRADIALAVIHREISYRDFSTDEQFAGISIVMSR